MSTASGWDGIDPIEFNTPTSLHMMCHSLYSNSSAGPSLPKCPSAAIKCSLNPRLSESVWNSWKCSGCKIKKTQIRILEKPPASYGRVTLSESQYPHFESEAMPTPSNSRVHVRIK